MKVLFLIDTLIGYGAEKSLAEIIIQFKKIQPVVIHLYEGDQLKERLQKNGVKVYSLNLKAEEGTRTAVRILKPIIKAESPKIIHTTLFRSEMTGRTLKSLFPEILLVGSLVSNSYAKNRFDQLSLLSQIKLFSTQLRDMLTAVKVDYFISNSRAIKRSNVKALNINKDKVEVIYRGRYDFSQSTTNIESILKELNLGEKKIFLNVGRLQQSKGQLDLIKAFRYFHKEHPDSVLLIAGEGKFKKELEDCVKRNNLESHVYLLGYRNDISEILALSDYFIFPSYYEGLPGAVIEAILSRIPVILSDIPENKECVPDNTALFFKVGSINEIQQKMEEALRIEDWNIRKNNAYQYASMNFNIEDVGAKYEDFYFRIVENLL